MQRGLLRPILFVAGSLEVEHIILLDMR